MFPNDLESAKLINQKHSNLICNFFFFLRLQKFIAVLQVEVAKSNISNSDANCAEERKKER
jgi:hypothetical protein